MGLLVVHKGEILHSSHGQLIRFQYQPLEFPEYVRRIPDALLVGPHIATKIKDVAEYWEGRKGIFQMAATPISTPGNAKDWEVVLGPELASHRPNWNTEQAMLNNGLHVKYIGWKRKEHGKYEPKHFVIDPHLFAHYLPESFRRYTLEEMYEWASDLLTWFEENNIQPAPSYHKISAQLLRQYFNEGPSPSLNEQLRPALPGNHYRYFANPKICYPSVYEIDQSSAHHHSALTIDFPLKHSLRLFAHTTFPEDDSLYEAGTAKYERVTSMPGLYLMKMYAPHHNQHEDFLPPPFDTGGTYVAWVYSNELNYLLSCGVQPRYLIAGFVSDEVDVQPQLYAAKALEEIARATPLQKSWLKPALLATYGMLGAKPFEPVKIALRGEGEVKRFHVGRNKFMQLHYVKHPQGFARYANIIHRGMIEAETRKRTLKMARYLREDGYNVLAIYADGVYISAEQKQLPLIGSNWRITKIDNVYFPKTGQVICEQFEKVPGMIGKLRKAYVSKIRSQENK